MQTAGGCLIRENREYSQIKEIFLIKSGRKVKILYKQSYRMNSIDKQHISKKGLTGGEKILKPISVQIVVYSKV